MHRRHRFVLAVALAMAASSCAPVRSAPIAPEEDAPRVIGYLASWGVRSKGTRIAELPGAELTHINYAFANISDDGRMILGDACVDIGECDGVANAADAGVSSGGNFAQLRLLKHRYPHLAILVAVGGWTRSGKFSDVAVSEESRRAFVRSGIEVFLRGWPGLFDGFDIDWEFPVAGGLPQNAARPEDKGNFTLLLGELRRQLDAEGARDGRRYLLTAATAAGPRLVANLELDRIAPLLDWINVMTYDYHAGSGIAHFNSPLYSPADDPTPQLNVHSTVQLYLASGVPPEKIIIGVPFYGRGYGGVPPVNNGLYQPAGGAPPDWGPGGLDYRRLARTDLDALGLRRFWHPEARVPWLYDESTGYWITYDDAESIGIKADYARAQGLGGVMAWELGGDDGTLVRMIRARLHREDLSD